MAFKSVADETRAVAAIPTGRGAAEARDECLGDLRFRAPMSGPDWDALPPAVRRRFSRRLAGGATAVYTGRVTEARMSRAFSFTLDLVHPRVGELIRQTATFREAGPCT